MREAIWLTLFMLAVSVLAVLIVMDPVDVTVPGGAEQARFDRLP